MKLIVAILLVFAVVTECTFGSSIKNSCVGMDRVEFLQEILRRLLIPNCACTLGLENDVGFLAWPRGDYPTTARQVIKFNSVDRNEGNGYSTNTGMFVAPVPGLYHIYWSILSFRGKPFALHLMLNGKERLKSWVHAQETFERPSGSVYLRLQKGDKVYLEASDSGGVIRTSRYSSFGGELIRY